MKNEENTKGEEGSEKVMIFIQAYTRLTAATSLLILSLHQTLLRFEREPQKQNSVIHFKYRYKKL